MKLAFIFVLLIAAFVTWKWVQAHPHDIDTPHSKVAETYSPGQIFSVRSSRGFKVLKILAVDADTVHIRIYDNEYQERPKAVDVRSLKIANPIGPDGSGAGYVAVVKARFSSWNPVMIEQAAVSADELQGYRKWQHPIAEPQ